MPTTKLQSVVSALALVVALALWISYCHDPSVRAGQRLRDSTTVVDSHRHATDARVARLAAESLELGNRLLRSQSVVESARRETARLRGYTRTDITVATPPDTLVAQIAIRDSVIDQLIGERDAVDSQLTIWKALAQERGDLLSQALQQRDAYRGIANGWQHKAEPGPFTKLTRALPYMAAGVLVGRLLK